MNEFRLRFGEGVWCGEQRCGTLARVALSPETRQVTHLIVEDGLLFKNARVLPFSALVSPDAAAADGAIHVDLPAEGIETYPTYREEVLEMPEHEQAAYGGASGAWREVSTYGAAADIPAPMIAERVHHGVPAESVVFHSGTKIEDMSGDVGRLDGMLVSADDGTVTAILMRQGLLFSNRETVPAPVVKAMGESILLSAVAAEGD